jgi:hypothetical protein
MERIENLNADHFYHGLDLATNELEARNLANDNLDVPITIVLTTTGEIGPAGNRMVNVLTYINGTPSQIIRDLDQN